jgi:hypothetical protein
VHDRLASDAGNLEVKQKKGESFALRSFSLGTADDQVL